MLIQYDETLAARAGECAGELPTIQQQFEHQQQLQVDREQIPTPPSEVLSSSNVWEARVKGLGRFSMASGAEDGYGMGC